MASNSESVPGERTGSRPLSEAPGVGQPPGRPLDLRAFEEPESEASPEWSPASRPVTGGPGPGPARAEAERLHEHYTPGGTQNTRSQGGPLMGLDAGTTVHRNRGEGFLDRPGRGRPAHAGLTAREVMTCGVRCIGPEATLREVAELMEVEDVGVLPVCAEGRRLLGMITDRDLVVRSFKLDRPPSQVKVSEVMTDELEAVTGDEPVHDVVALMGSKQIRRVPVVGPDDRLLGIIALGDLATRADCDQDLQRALQRISGRRSFWAQMFR